MRNRVRDLPKHVYPKGKRNYLYFTKGNVTLRLPDVDDANFEYAYKQACETWELEAKDRGQRIKTADGENYFTAMQRSARTRARRAGREYSLPDEWMSSQYEAQDGLCALSGILMVKRDKKHDPFAPSIDRIDSTAGYTPDNCQLVIYAVNTAKNQFSMETFLQVCRAVVRHSRRTKQKRNVKEETVLGAFQK